jgi:hypothetical protein
MTVAIMAVPVGRPCRHQSIAPSIEGGHWRCANGLRLLARGRAAPDGYTPLLGTLYDKLKFNFIHDIAPVAGIIRVPKRHGGTSIVSGHERFPSSSLKTLYRFGLHERRGHGVRADPLIVTNRDPGRR